MTTLYPGHELLLLDEAVWVLLAPTGLPVYDFRFDHFLPCRHPWQWQSPIEAVARVGAIADYRTFYQEMLLEGIRLIHTPEDHKRCSELPDWYPLLVEWTPKSVWFETIPTVQEVMAHLHWPIFVKGSRQTSRHQRSLSVLAGPEAFAQAMDAYRQDPILRWQKVVCREYVPLRLVEDPNPERLPSCFEFRTFWWKGELAGYGRYWWEGKSYALTEKEKTEALAVAQEAAQRVAVGYLVVDVAQAADGRWLVIECNDGQESGYAGVSPLALWQNIARMEKERGMVDDRGKVGRE